MHKPERKIRSKPENNFYVPPPARKLDESNSYALSDNKNKDRSHETKLKSVCAETKVCNNSSLLFKSENRSRLNKALLATNESKKKRRRKKKSVSPSEDSKIITNKNKFGKSIPDAIEDADDSGVLDANGDPDVIEVTNLNSDPAAIGYSNLNRNPEATGDPNLNCDTDVIRGPDVIPKLFPNSINGHPDVSGEDLSSFSDVNSHADISGNPVISGHLDASGVPDANRHPDTHGDPVVFGHANVSEDPDVIVDPIEGLDIPTDYMDDNFILGKVEEKDLALNEPPLIKYINTDREFKNFSDLDSFLVADDSYDNDMREISYLIREVASADINLSEDDDIVDNNDGDNRSLIPSSNSNESYLSSNMHDQNVTADHESLPKSVTSPDNIDFTNDSKFSNISSESAISISSSSVLSKDGERDKKNIDNLQYCSSSNADFEYEWEKLLDNDVIDLNTKPSTKVTTPGSIKVSKPQSRDSVEDNDKERNDSSVIEIYGFPEEFKTQDLLVSFSYFIKRGFKLKWVDDTHALGIFPTPAIADEALSSSLPFVKTRPLSQASAASKEKAKNIILPPALRPKTCPALARRLVSGALGVKAVFTKAEREAEREMLKQAREEKRLAAKQRDAAWEGKF